MNEWFKREYERMTKDYLNDSTLLQHRYLVGTWEPPPWHKRIRNHIKNKVWDGRVWAANKLAGFDVLDRDW